MPSLVPSDVDVDPPFVLLGCPKISAKSSAMRANHSQDQSRTACSQIARATEKSFAIVPGDQNHGPETSSLCTSSSHVSLQAPLPHIGGTSRASHIHRVPSYGTPINISEASSRSSSPEAEYVPCASDLSVEAFALDVDTILKGQFVSFYKVQDPRATRNVSFTSSMIPRTSLGKALPKSQVPRTKRLRQHEALHTSIFDGMPPSSRLDCNASQPVGQFNQLSPAFCLPIVSIKRMPSTTRITLEEAYGIQTSRAPGVIQRLSAPSSDQGNQNSPTDISVYDGSSSNVHHSTPINKEHEMSAQTPETLPCVIPSGTCTQPSQFSVTGLPQSRRVSGTTEMIIPRTQEDIMQHSVDIFDAIVSMLRTQPCQPHILVGGDHSAMGVSDSGSAIVRTEEKRVSYPGPGPDYENSDVLQDIFHFLQWSTSLV